MRSVGIQELKDNPSLLSQTLEKKEYVLLTEKGIPIGVGAPFDDDVLGGGLKRWLALKAFRNGDLSLSQLAGALGLGRMEALKLLGDLNILIADYDLDEDLETIEKYKLGKRS
jgi:predicted HTH domain antitoxin